MNRIFHLVIFTFLAGSNADIQQFNLCSQKSLFNVNSSGQATITKTTMSVSSEIQCCRKCSDEIDCIGVNVKSDPTTGLPAMCDVIMVSGGLFLDYCALTEEVHNSVFYQRGSGIQVSNKVFEIDSSGSVIFGSTSEIENKLKEGERMRIMLRNFNFTKNDALVRADVIHMSDQEICAQSVFNFHLKYSWQDIERIIVHICVSGRVELQVWQVRKEMLYRETYMNAASVWYSDGVPKTQVISTNGSGDLDTVLNSVNNGQDIVTYRTNIATPHYNIWINATDLRLKNPWDLSIQNPNAAIQLYTTPYWFATTQTNINDLVISRFDMETSRLISDDYIHNYYKAYFLDQHWLRVDISDLQTYLDQGKQLRVVVNEIAETVDIIQHELSSGDFLYLMDRMVDTTGDYMKQVFFILNSHLLQKYVVDEERFTYNCTETENVTINLFVENRIWTLIHVTSKDSTANATGVAVEEAFNNGKQFE